MNSWQTGTKSGHIQHRRMIIAWCSFSWKILGWILQSDQVNARKCWVIIGNADTFVLVEITLLSSFLPPAPRNKRWSWLKATWFGNSVGIAEHPNQQLPLLPLKQEFVFGSLEIQIWQFTFALAASDGQEDPMEEDYMDWTYTYCTYDGMEWMTGTGFNDWCPHDDQSVGSASCPFRSWVFVLSPRMRKIILCVRLLLEELERQWAAAGRSASEASSEKQEERAGTRNSQIWCKLIDVLFSFVWFQSYACGLLT